MRFNVPVSNPLLVGAIEVMKADPTVEHKSMFIGELVKAEFLTPVMVSPDPTQDEEGNWHLPLNPQLSFPTMGTKDETQQYFMAFTDQSELDKWEEAAGKYTCACTYEDFFLMLVQRNKTEKSIPVCGFIINPQGCNVMVNRDIMLNLFTRKHPPKS